MVTKVVYARLYNLGNYENERFEVEVTVEDGSEIALAGAWDDARRAVEDQKAALEVLRAQEQQRQRDEWTAKQAESLAAQRQNKEVPF